MNRFSSLYNRLKDINEARVSPYAAAHPSFGNITKQLKIGGLSSAPLDTIKFIRETLYMLEIIDDEELNKIKTGKGFSGKKQAMLAVLRDNQDIINQRSEEIAERVNSTLDDFIGGAGVNRGREEKYAAQAAAVEMANQMRQASSGKEMDDALADIVDGEALIVRASIAKILGEINRNLGDPGFDIEQLALDEVSEFVKQIDSVAKLKSFVQQISSEPGYEKIAAYLSSAIKPIQNGTEDEEMVEDEESEPMAKDTDDARDLGGKLYQGNRHGRVGKDGIRRTPEQRMRERGLRKFNPTTGRYEMPAEDNEEVDGFDIGQSDDNIPEEVVEDFLEGKSDQLLIALAYDEGIEEIVVLDGDGGLANRDEVIEELRNLDDDNDLDEGGELKEGPVSSPVPKSKRKWRDIGFGEGDIDDSINESYTSIYMTKQKLSDKYAVPKKESYQSFGQHFKPKTSWQLEELAKMGYGRY